MFDRASLVRLFGTGSPRARRLLAMISAQLGLHSAMSGVRMASVLLVLSAGGSAWSVGLVLALYSAAPVLLAMHTGRVTDRVGYHLPMRWATGLVAAGALLALIAAWLEGPAQFGLLCLAAALCGAGANTGVIATQRSAGSSVGSSLERMKVFSWLGLAPSFSNVVGTVTAGICIDIAGYATAFGVMLALPLLGLWFVRQVPVEAPRAALAGPRLPAWDLLKQPGMRRLLFVNGLLTACWDVHSIAVPILGHERGFSASTIGLILGVFPLAVTAVRLVIPLLAHRMREIVVLRSAMLATAVVFAVYPLAASPLLMMVCSVALGFALGSVQPMIMSTLHDLTPDDRHGEAIALRSMTINLASTLLPLAFGAAGSAVGVSALFWFVGGATAAASWPARLLERIKP